MGPSQSMYFPLLILAQFALFWFLLTISCFSWLFCLLFLFVCFISDIYHSHITGTKTDSCFHCGLGQNYRYIIAQNHIWCQNQRNITVHQQVSRHSDTWGPKSTSAYNKTFQGKPPSSNPSSTHHPNELLLKNCPTGRKRCSNEAGRVRKQGRWDVHEGNNLVHLIFHR